MQESATSRPIETEPAGSVNATLLKLAAVSLITLLVGYTVFVRTQKDFSDYL